MIKLLSLVFISVFCVSQIHGIKRTLTARLNPGNDNASNTTLIHIIANGESDQLHYIWDFMRRPSILVAQTDHNTNLTIDWKNLATHGTAVRFLQPPKYSMALVLTKIFLFDDTEDRASLLGVNDDAIETINTNSFNWSRDIYEATQDQVVLQISGRNETLLGEDGLIRVNLTCYGSQGVERNPPHLSHSFNATEITIEFMNLNITKPTIQSMRAGAEIVLIANETAANSFNVAEQLLNDDGRAPGSFKLIDVLSPGAMNNSHGSYIQFRPIAYKNESRTLVTQTDVQFNTPLNITNPSKYLDSSIAWSFYGTLLEDILVQSFNISFGQKNDGFYTETDYVSWSFVFGFGYAEPESISVVAIVVACLVLGLPLLVLVAAGVYLGIKRLRNC